VDAYAEKLDKEVHGWAKQLEGYCGINSVSVRVGKIESKPPVPENDVKAFRNAVSNGLRLVGNLEASFESR